MPDVLTQILAVEGLGWMALTFLVAGLVRGFTGFGTALIFMPVGAIFLPMPVAITVVMIAGMATWPLIVPRAFREADRNEVFILSVAAVLTAPLGVWILGWADRDALRWAVSLAAMITLAALVSGWRYRGKVNWPGLGGIGAAAGVLGGTTGLTGPPVILFYLAGQGAAASVRANTILFLALLDIGIVANFLWQDLITMDAVWLALGLAIPYGTGILIGQRLFQPDRERLYRLMAYSVIALAIVTGLPLFTR